jgi:uncharacterized membrane protein YoaK (UPF0700 family)
MPAQQATDYRVPLLLLLSATTGLVDAASVLGLGRVFTANMTGNVVFLGFAAAGVPGFAWLSFVVAIASFMLGAVAGGRTYRRFVGRPLRQWLLVSAIFESVLLFVAGVMAIGLGLGTPEPTQLYTIIALTGIAMGFRNATVRQMKVADLTTTVLTLTVTGIAADSKIAGGGGTNWGRRVGAILAIFGGSLIGAVMLVQFGLTAPLVFAGVLILFGTLAFIAHPAAGEKIA